MNEDIRYNIFLRSREIEDLIINNEVRRVTLLLLDFDRDFDASKVYYSEILLLCADSKQYEDNRRIGIIDLDRLERDRKSILLKAFNLIDEIVKYQRSVA